MEERGKDQLKLDIKPDASTMEQFKALVKTFDELKALKKALKDKTDLITKQITETEQAIISFMASFGWTSIGVEGFEKGIVELDKKVYPGYRKENEDKVFEIIRSLGSGDIIKPTLNDKTFKTWYRELTEEHKALFKEVVRTFEKASIKRKK